MWMASPGFPSFQFPLSPACGKHGQEVGAEEVGGPPFLAGGVAGHSSCVEAFPPHTLTSIALTYPSHIILIFCCCSSKTNGEIKGLLNSNCF